MRGQPTTFWGKLRRDDGGEVTDWHPLVDHCADVAAVAEALLGLPTWRARLGHLVGLPDLDPVTRARLSVIAALHDLGKFNLGFQAKGRPDLGAPAGHVVEAIAALFKSPVGSVLGPLGAWGPGVGGLLISSIGHHGRPEGHQHDGEHQVTRWRPRCGLDPEGGLRELLEACLRWFPAAFDSAAPPLPDAAAFEHAFAGLVMLADWLGSDTAYFPYTGDSGEPRMDRSRATAGEVLRGMKLEVLESDRTAGGGRSPFARVTGGVWSPRPAQAAVVELGDLAPGSITIVESETGSGKTEAALAHFVRLYSEGKVDGLYFALPTRTAATQLHARVFKAITEAFEAPPPVVLAVPGYIRADDAEARRLPGFEVLWPDQGQMRYRGWAAEMPKRYLAGAIVVGTIDQVLLSGLMVRHAHLRATALLRHLLVVDEVHASDAYMNRILEEVLERHIAAGGHAVLLSATLGGEARTRLLAPRSRAVAPSLGEAVDTPYPLVSHRDSRGVGRVAPQHDGGSRTIGMEVRPWLESPASTVEVALSAARAGAKVLIIKNTVVECVAHQEALEAVAGEGRRELLFSCAGHVAPHHARFSRPDREALDRALEQRLGKVRKQGGLIVVATQTVQQSLDIDADLLITDLCPADVMLQRLGRLHRHSRSDRPGGFEQPRAIVVVPEERDLGRLIGESGRARHYYGLGSVYSDLRVLEGTWRLLEEATEWMVPDLNRAYVEGSVHSDALGGIVSELGGLWPKHAAHVLGEERGEGRVAELNLVDWRKRYSETTFKAVEDRLVSSRLGEGDRRVQFSPAFRGPFGLEVKELTVRASWAQGVDPEAFETTAVRCSTGRTTFSFGPKTFVYDRLGLRPQRTGEDVDGDGP